MTRKERLQLTQEVHHARALAQEHVDTTRAQAAAEERGVQAKLQGEELLSQGLRSEFANVQQDLITRHSQQVQQVDTNWNARYTNEKRATVQLRQALASAESHIDELEKQNRQGHLTLTNLSENQQHLQIQLADKERNLAIVDQERILSITSQADGNVEQQRMMMKMESRSPISSSSSISLSNRRSTTSSRTTLS